ncbi:MAG: outer membrane protein assembly factor BamC [Methylococcales bacterium]|nr:outer membrane protein assembly factor BamC [Methylococcales bacterium]
MVIAMLSSLSGCALKKHFPNKEKDYEFRKEIPSLVIPNDLKPTKFQPVVLVEKKPTIETIQVPEKETVVIKKPTSPLPNEVTEKITHTEVAPKDPIKPTAAIIKDTEREEITVMVDMIEGPAAKPVPSSNLENYSFDEPVVIKPEPDISPPVENFTKPDIKAEAPEKPIETEALRYVDFIMFDAGATRLRTNEKFTPIWRLVGKALSHNHIEITLRDKASGQFIVQYDPDRIDYLDDGVKEEFWFIFSDNNINEKEFRIRVISHNNNIEILVLDESNTPLSDGTGLKLLKLIFNTLHSALSAQK